MFSADFLKRYAALDADDKEILEAVIVQLVEVMDTKEKEGAAVVLVDPIGKGPPQMWTMGNSFLVGPLLSVAGHLSHHVDDMASHVLQ